MIYLSPLMLIGSALVLTSKRIDWRIVAAATALVLFLIFEKPMRAELPVLRGARLRDPHDPEPALGLGRRRPAAGARRGARRSGCCLLAFRRFTAVVAAAVGALVRLDADRRDHEHASASRTSPTRSAAACARRSTGSTATRAGSRRPTSARRSANPNGILLTEFWNRSLRHVYSLDGTRARPRPDRHARDRLDRRAPVAHARPTAGSCSPTTASTLQGAAGRHAGAASPLPQARPVEAARRRAAGLRGRLGAATGRRTRTSSPASSGTLDVTLSRTAYNGDGASPGTRGSR